MARKRQRETTGKCEGRKSHAELQPDVVKLAKALSRKTKAGRMSLRAIAKELAADGKLNEGGVAYNPKSIAAMLAA